MTEHEIQQNNINELILLTQQNPTLKIVPMVDSDLVCGDDFARWMGSWGKPDLDEVYHVDERIYFRSLDEVELINELADNMNDAENTPVEEAYLKAKELVGKYNWEKVIAVNINTP